MSRRALPAHSPVLHHGPLRRHAALLLLLGLTTACAETQPASFYTLTDLRAAGGTALAERTAEEPLVVGLGPVTLPQYLDRPQIVTRSDRNALALAEFNRWAEPLHDTVVRVLRENLSYLLGTERIVPLPSRRTRSLDVVVEVDVLAFETRSGGRSLLAANWSVFRPDAREPLLVRRSEHDSTVPDPTDFASVAAAMSASLNDLSLTIAEAVRRHAKASQSHAPLPGSVKRSPAKAATPP